MTEKIVKTGIRREEGWLYYIDKKGNVARTRMMRGFPEQQRGSAEILVKTELNRENGWLYYIDKDGDVARVKMVGLDPNAAQKADDGVSSEKVSKKSEQKKKIASPPKKIGAKSKITKPRPAKKKILKKKK